MAENLKKKPSKGILKNSSSFDIHDTVSAPKRTKKGSAKWDEMNIMATLHPPDKDYGHMKIDEPKTPYNFEGLEDIQDMDTLDANELAERIRLGALTKPKALQSNDDSDEDDDLTPEEREQKKEFDTKRKKHYNEYYAVKLARKLLEKDEEDEANENASSSSPDATKEFSKPETNVLLEPKLANNDTETKNNDMEKCSEPEKVPGTENVLKSESAKCSGLENVSDPEKAITLTSERKHKGCCTCKPKKHHKNKV